MRLPRAAFLMITGVLSCGGKVVVNETAAAGAGGSSACPVVAPHDGAPCDPPGLACKLPFLCCSPTATCVAGVWNLQGSVCSDACTPCRPDGESCAISGVCVVSSVVALATYTCAENPCGAEALSCTCAASVCPGGCLQVSGSTVQCNSFSQ